MNQPLISLTGITKKYHMGDQSLCALSIDSLTIMPREWVSIVGPSGSGKTTLLHILGCLDTPTTGRYLLNGTSVAHRSAQEQAHIRNTEIGFIFQRFHLLPTLTAAENIALPLRYAGLAPHIIEKKVDEMLTLIQLHNRKHHYPHQLSGGQQQRVAIGRALVTEPSLILADEPTGSLDSHTGTLVLSFLKELHEKKPITIVLITHDGDVARYGTRKIYIKDGSIESDTPIK